MPTLKLSDIIVDQRTQQRELDAENVERLAELIVDGGSFNDPLDVFSDGADCWLAHGHHRYTALLKAGKDRAACELHNGTLEDAIDFSCRPLNAAHGQPERQADRTRRVHTMLSRHTNWTDSRLANHCGVSDKTVTSHRCKMESNSEIPSCPERQAADGRTFTAPPKREPRESPPAPKAERTTETVIVNTATGEVLEDAEAVISTVTTKRPTVPQASPRPMAKPVRLDPQDPEWSASQLVSHFGRSFALSLSHELESIGGTQ